MKCLSDIYADKELKYNEIIIPYKILVQLLYPNIKFELSFLMLGNEIESYIKNRMDKKSELITNEINTFIENNSGINIQLCKYPIDCAENVNSLVCNKMGGDDFVYISENMYHDMKFGYCENNGIISRII